jgi:dethiobiotin synthetase
VSRGSLGTLVVVTGTGTGIGKTHLTTALATLAGQTREDAVVAAWKPIESGVGSDPTDHDALREASSFHVKQDLDLLYGLAAPISPHLAARREGVTIDLAPVVERARLLRARAHLVLVELPGGLFTPLSDDALNIDLLRALAPTATILVAPNRLGVLHDVLATTRAATLPFTAIALTSLAPPDASTTTNASELRRLLRLDVVEIPSAPVADLFTTDALATLLDLIWPSSPREVGWVPKRED